MMMKYVEQFLVHIDRERHLSENTIDSYKRDLVKWVNYLSAKGIHDLLKVTDTDVITFTIHLKQKGRASSTISRQLASLHTFYTFLQQEEIISKNPVNNIERPRKEEKTIQILTINEIENLLNQPDDSNLGMRDSAMLEVLYATGIRVSELITLTLSDINLEMGYIKCSSAKKKRIIPIGKVAKRALQQYIENGRAALIRENEDILFLNYAGRPISRQGFWKVVKRYVKDANIDKAVTPHTLRHSFAMHLIQNGADLYAVQEMLGHADIKSTQKYIEMSRHDIRDIYKKAHPRAE